MSNIIPYMLSSPPPLDDQVDDEEDDEFGDFRVADHSISITDFNNFNETPDSPDHWMKETLSPKILNEGTGQGEPVVAEAWTDKLTNGLSNIPDVNEDSAKGVEDNNMQFETSDKINDFKREESTSLPKDVPLDALCIKDKLESENYVSDNLNESGNLVYESGQESCIQYSNVSDTGNESIPEVALINDTNEAFEAPSEEVQSDKLSCDNNLLNTASNDFDDFHEFNTVNYESVPDDNSFSDFTDFNDCKTSSLTQDESGDKNNCSSKSIDNISGVDDFLDFKSCESVEEISIENVLKNMFGLYGDEPVEEMDVLPLTDCLHSCLDDSSSVWGHLKELETSPALSYQWSNSSSNRSLLSSLNIDSRNILFGPRWTSSIPKFAANLGFSPLEPVKASDISSSSQSSNSTFSPSTSGNTITNTNGHCNSNVEEIVPAAQFDWTSSGLTNPLDSVQFTLLDVEFFTKFDDTPSANSSSSYAADSLWKSIGMDKEGFSSAGDKNSVQLFAEEDSEQVVPKSDPEQDVCFKEEGEENVKVDSESDASPPAMEEEEDEDTSQKLKAKSELSAEACAVVDSFPDLSFLSARKLMFAANENMNRWRIRP